MKEKNVENSIKRYLFEKKHLYFKVHGDRFTEKGISDIIACVKGRFVAIEVKKPNNKKGESENQKLFGRNVIKSKGYYIVADTLEDVINLVENIEKEN